MADKDSRQKASFLAVDTAIGREIATEEDARHGSAGTHLPVPDVPVAFDGAPTSWKQRTREGATFKDIFPRSPEQKEEAKAREARPALTRAKVARVVKLCKELHFCFEFIIAVRTLKW